MTHYIKNLMTSATIMVALATIGASVANASVIDGTLSSNGSYSAAVVTTNSGGPTAQNAGGLTDLTGIQNPATNKNANQLAAVVTSGASLSGWLLWILLAVLLTGIGYYLYRRNRDTRKVSRQNIN